MLIILQIDINDKLPTHICDPCLDALNISDKLRSQCLLADSILRRQLKPVGVKDPEPDFFAIKVERQDGEEESSNDEYSAFNTENNHERHSESIPKICKQEIQSSDDLHQQENEEDNEKNESEEENDLSYTNNASNFVAVNLPDYGIDIKQEAISENDETLYPPIEKPLVSLAGSKVSSPKSKRKASKSKASLTKTTCDICNVTIKEQELVKLHVKFHELRGMFCNYCSTTLPSPYDLYLHKKTVHKIWTSLQMKWFCEKCETITGYDKCIKNHIKQCKKTMFRCKYCSKEFAYRKEWKAHQKARHYENMVNDPDVVKFTCDSCDKSYFDRDVYTQHLRRHRAMQDGKYKCPYCSKLTASSFVLKNHIQATHDRKRVFKCDICQKEFYNERNMKAHKRLHKKLTCSRCDEQFANLTLLDQHLLDLHNAVVPKRRKYNCKECGAEFRRLLLLQDHENVHTGKRPYTCELCNKTFRTYANHWAHQQRHKTSGFYCDYCKQKFLTKRNLKKHIPSHQGPEEWTYSCEICDIKFPNDARLQRHMEKDRDEHMKTCDICGLEMLGMQRLRRHRSQKHDIWENNDSTERE
uniref:C2H2-type domain-containing protein n=1 Tax=Bracon brevicornis TaxID=1563983 RepID=A0A6V7I3Z0_9HYME